MIYKYFFLIIFSIKTFSIETIEDDCCLPVVKLDTNEFKEFLDSLNFLKFYLKNLFTKIVDDKFEEKLENDNFLFIYLYRVLLYSKDLSIKKNIDLNICQFLFKSNSLDRVSFSLKRSSQKIKNAFTTIELIDIFQITLLSCLLQISIFLHLVYIDYSKDKKVINSYAENIKTLIEKNLKECLFEGKYKEIFDFYEKIMIESLNFIHNNKEFSLDFKNKLNIISNSCINCIENMKKNKNKNIYIERFDEILNNSLLTVGIYDLFPVLKVLRIEKYPFITISKGINNLIENKEFINNNPSRICNLFNFFNNRLSFDLSFIKIFYLLFNEKSYTIDIGALFKIDFHNFKLYSNFSLLILKVNLKKIKNYINNIYIYLFRINDAKFNLDKIANISIMFEIGKGLFFKKYEIKLSIGTSWSVNDGFRIVFESNLFNYLVVYK